LDPRLVIRWPEIIGLIRKDGNPARTDYERNVQQMLMDIPMQILDKSELLNHPELQTAHELRANDQMLQAAGFPVEGLEELEEFAREYARGQKPNPPAAKAADLPTFEEPPFEDPFR
jgi:hypothetical protein